MARYGYILHSADDATVRDIEDSGCCRIFRECRYDTQTRPERRTLLRRIGNDDEIIVPRLCHIVNGCSNLAVLLEYCEVRNIRLVSIGDRIDTAGILYDGESDRNIVSAFKTLASDVADIKKRKRRKASTNAVSGSNVGQGREDTTRQPRHKHVPHRPLYRGDIKAQQHQQDHAVPCTAEAWHTDREARQETSYL